MDIFESLENLNVSEECFDEIMDMVEELLSEDIHSAIDTYAKTDKKGRDELHRKATDAQTKEQREALGRAKAKSVKAWKEALINRGVGVKVGSRAWQDEQVQKALDRRDEREWNKMHGWNPKKA